MENETLTKKKDDDTPTIIQTRMLSSVLLLLEEQYTITEAYANAQTQLWNVTQQQQRQQQRQQSSSQGLPLFLSSNDTTTTIRTGKDSLISSAVEHHFNALRKVQDNLQKQQQQHQLLLLQDKNRYVYKQQQQHLQRHLELTQRVLQTLSVYPCSWHTNGVPFSNASSSSFQQKQPQLYTTSPPAMVVAMATLKASIVHVLEQYHSS
jgi:hypothetical protein